jgi:hypothetical protein
MIFYVICVIFVIRVTHGHWSFMIMVIRVIHGHSCHAMCQQDFSGVKFTKVGREGQIYVSRPSARNAINATRRKMITGQLCIN